MLRRWGVATCAAAWRNAAGVFSSPTISESVRPAPNAVPLRFISGMFFKETRTAGDWCRRFMFGSRSVPPAMSIARGPSPARIFAASATLRGARCSNHGSLSIAPGFLAVAVFPRREDEGGLGIGNGRIALRPDPLVLVLERLQHLVGRD